MCERECVYVLPCMYACERERGEEGGGGGGEETYLE